MINNTTLVGRLTKNPELRYTASGIAVLSFTLAVERNYTDAQGQKETDFINCVAWRGSAEAISQFTVKGSLIGITGNIQTRNYQNNDGYTVYVTEVVIDTFQMLEPKSVTDERRAQAGQGNYNTGQQTYNNGQGNSPTNQNNQNMGQANTTQNADAANNPIVNPEQVQNYDISDDVTDISDDDLPF